MGWVCPSKGLKQSVFKANVGGMRRDIVSIGAGQLRYEIREIVQTAHLFRELGVEIAWENIGDPVQKGELIESWIMDIVAGLTRENRSYGYTDSAGNNETRAFLAAMASRRCNSTIGEDDILFFNGLGDAVSTTFSNLRREARVLGPSPAYSTLSSAEAAHSGYDHLTYTLDPKNNWQPNVEDIRLKVRYNDSIAGILIINPDNPTGAVYPGETLQEIVDICREYDLFVLCDETYANIVYPGRETAALSEVIGDVPGLAMRSISKEVPWPGARCGWIEVYNQEKDEIFRCYITSLLDSKRLEVCSTTLPQLAIPRIFSHPEYPGHLKRRAAMFARRAHEAVKILSTVPNITVVKPGGAFYLTVVFDVRLPEVGPLPDVGDRIIAEKLKKLTTDVAPDKRFVYWLLASTGICSVPLSGFCSNSQGFRTTLLENNDEKRRFIYESLARAINIYVNQK